MAGRRRLVAGALAAGAASRTAAAEPPASAPGEQARALHAVVTRRVALRYLLWLPAPARRPARGWPLLIFLHGSGERGRDLAQLKVYGPPRAAAEGRPFPFVLAAPQAEPGCGWDVDAIEALRAELVARLPIDPDRVLLTGLSLGGYGTWNYAVEYPQHVAAIAPVCGVGDADRAERLARVPVWAFHGAHDEAVPIAGDREMVEAVRAAGGQVRFTVYPELGHNCWDAAYAEPDFYDWLLAQRRAGA